MCIPICIAPKPTVCVCVCVCVRACVCMNWYSGKKKRGLASSSALKGTTSGSDDESRFGSTGKVLQALYDDDEDDVEVGGWNMWGAYFEPSIHFE